MSTPAPLDPAHFSLGKHGHPVQNGEIFFVSKSMGAWIKCRQEVKHLKCTSVTTVDCSVLTSDDLMLESQQIGSPGPLLNNCAWPHLWGSSKSRWTLWGCLSCRSPHWQHTSHPLELCTRQYWCYHTGSCSHTCMWGRAEEGQCKVLCCHHTHY